MVKTAKAILDSSPTNVRGHLALARAFTIAQDFRAAAAEYDRLLTVDPTYLVPLLEKARVLFAGHDFEASASTYHRAQQPGPEEWLQFELASVLQTHPQLHQDVAPCLNAITGVPTLPKELTRLAVTLPDPALQAVVAALLRGAEARAAEVSAIKLKADAKGLRTGADFAAKALS